MEPSDLYKCLLGLEKKITDQSYVKDLQISNQQLLIDIQTKRMDEMKQEILELKKVKDGSVQQIVRLATEKSAALKEVEILAKNFEILKRERDHLLNLNLCKDKQLVEIAEQKKRLRRSYNTLNAYHLEQNDNTPEDIKDALFNLKESLKSSN